MIIAKWLDCVSIALAMHDVQIRASFHQKWLRKHHCDSATLVIDELGLQHGRCRADIAVIHSHLIGYEIKSDVDSLQRLNDQINSYNAVFDYASAVVATSHLSKTISMLPEWWGMISVSEDQHGAVHFKTIRYAKKNACVDDYAIAQLLWRSEAQDILIDLGIHGKALREKRANLYSIIVSKMGSIELRETVKKYLMKRINWRPNSPYRPVAPTN